jgi:hypothetical protein
MRGWGERRALQDLLTPPFEQIWWYSLDSAFPRSVEEQGILDDRDS